jgi:hypothetical protein
MVPTSVPNHLYKYRPFNAHTLRLLSRGEAYYADPTTFNDPLDCRPVVRLDTDVATLEKLCIRMVTSVLGETKASDTIEEHRYLSTQGGEYRKNDEEAIYIYTIGLRQEITALLYGEMRRNRVLSLAGRWNCPLMWSHYADEHRGICIQYDTADNKCERLLKVRYASTGDIKISQLHDWKVSGSTAAGDAVRDTFFYTKSVEWRYEMEWRDLSASTESTDAPLQMSAVYFGLRCDSAVATAIVKLFHDFSRAIKFYDVYRRDDSFRLRRRAVDVDAVVACGVQSSRRWDFDEIPF